MKAFNCDKCKETFRGHPIVYDVCTGCMPAFRELLDAADKPEPEAKPRPEQGEVLATILRSVANEIERRGVGRFNITEKREQVETTLGIGYPRTFASMGQIMTLSWNWATAKED